MSHKRTETDIDHELEDTFPASDPPSWNPGTASRRKPKNGNNQNAKWGANWLQEKERWDQKKAEPDAIPVGMNDPAAAPMGTDQEAGGYVSPPEKP